MKLISAISCILLWNISFAQPKVVDKIAAQVGDNIVLLSDIESQKIQAVQSGIEVNAAFDCEVLEGIMIQHLLLNQAKIDSLDVTPEQVDAEMERRLRQIEAQIGSRQKMEAFYGKTVSQMKDEFRPSVYDQMLAEAMQDQITSGVTVTPREVEEFFKTVPDDSIPLINSQLGFQQIVHYPAITNADKERAFEKLEDIRKQIEGGKSFATMARIHSEDPGSASQGGEITASKGMMVPAFESAVFSLAKGQVSNVFESEYGYHIVKLVERLGDDYTCQHILIVPKFNDDELDRSASLMDSCYALLKAGTITWEEAVLKFSNDEATMQNKGTITNPYTGETLWSSEDLNMIDRQMYLLADNLDINEFSEPSLYFNVVDRKQGVRIVRLTVRTSPHRANLKDDYALIKSAAENDKKRKALENWVSDHITSAYIHINQPYDQCTFDNNWLKK